MVCACSGVCLPSGDELRLFGRDLIERVVVMGGSELVADFGNDVSHREGHRRGDGANQDGRPSVPVVLPCASKYVGTSVPEGPGARRIEYGSPP